jgi:hypothetical protein
VKTKLGLEKLGIAVLIVNEESEVSELGDAYIFRRLKAKDIRRYQGFTEDDEVFVQQVAPLQAEGALPCPKTKKIAEALKEEIEPVKVLGILRRDVPSPFFQPTRAQQTSHALNPREVILSSYILEAQ